MANKRLRDTASSPPDSYSGLPGQQTSSSSLLPTAPPSPKPRTNKNKSNSTTKRSDSDGGDGWDEPVGLRRKRLRAAIVIDDSVEEMQDTTATTPGEETNASDGLLRDINVQPISKASANIVKDRRRDVDHFFSPLFVKDRKTYRNCHLCSKGSPDHPLALVADITTCRRHMESHHKGIYLNWAEKNKFQSMLPKDARRRRDAAAADEQTHLDSHLKELPVKVKVIPYTDDLFRNVAIEWLVSTDQPIQAFQHPAFQKMIDTAARATNGVKIPNGRQTRQVIINTFKEQLTALRARLTSAAVKGKVSLTCNAWQASNVDAYFAVTGSWIEEVDGKWELQTALLGFTRSNSAHNGVRLGQALFKIVSRAGIAHKIGHVTCDNASNNATMLHEFAKHIWEQEGKIFDPTADRIRCLAHIINLAAQALITTHSKSKHYNPADPDADLVGGNIGRDVVGLVRAICVKARSSAKQKQCFADIQIRREVKRVRQLQIDMPVRWSSTYVMTTRAEEMRDIVNVFIYAIGRAEKDPARRQKIDDLSLSSVEWEQVKLFNNLLAHADNAQHAFSSDQEVTLHIALPALEALHKAWKSRLTREKYKDFLPALQAGLAKIEEYYDRTADSDTYTFAMLLDPSQKMDHIRKYWGAAKLDDILERAEQKYKECYLAMYGNNPPPPPKKTKNLTTRKVGVLLRELSEDEDEEEIPVLGDGSSGLHAPWRADFYGYLNSRDQLGGMTIIEWWGWNTNRYPVWASLAQDYLPIMVSSVSSERTFSSAGTTICKRRSRLRPDIIEALQFMKCIYRRELLFREEPSTAFETEESFEGTGDAVKGEGGAGKENGWDDFVGDLQDDEGFHDIDGDDIFVQTIV